MPKNKDTAADLFKSLVDLKRTYSMHNRRSGKLYLHPVAVKILSRGYPRHVMDPEILQEDGRLFRGLELGRLYGWDLVFGTDGIYPWQEEYPVFKTSLIPRLR